MSYIELKCRIEPYNSDISEILMAELSNLQYESFVENNAELLAYVKENDWDEELLSSLYITKNKDFKIKFSHKKIEQQNWNKTWEENYFKPINIDNRCVIKSTFHKDYPHAQYLINIDPKMAFGTGHHETTSLMIREILNIDVANKSILDMGCGTGILAILSAMKGATDIVAVDYDIWSYNNTIENMKLNNTKHIIVKHGDINILDDKKYDIIYANINKNVLLADIPEYAKRLNNKAYLMLSGFYESDFDDINKIAQNSNLVLVQSEQNNKWMMLKYQKQ